MKREIKFRGMTVSGEWVYGLLAKDLKGNTYISNSVGMPFAYQVRPETVSQYIGVKGYTGDYEKRYKNEIDLYEGDIVEAMSQGSKGRFVIKFRQEASPSFILFPAYQHKEMWSISASNLGRKDGTYYDDLKVIGNIYESPEKIDLNV